MAAGETRSCPACRAPLEEGRTFCGQCGFDLPAGGSDSDALPRPEKCPFCGAPVEGEELACRQCGFDFELDYEPEPGHDDEGEFDPSRRACSVCAELNPLTADFCAKCGAPIGAYASLKPIEKIFAEGFVYRRAVVRLPGLPAIVKVARVLLAAFFLFSAMVSAVAGVVAGWEALRHSLWT